MRKLVLLVGVLFLAMGAAYAQQVDLAFGLGGLSAPSSTVLTPTPVSLSEGGGVYPAISGDFLLKHNFGVEGEVAWRAGQKNIPGFLPFRPIFFAFNGIYAPTFGNRVSPELMAGIGGASTRFYTGTYTCNFVGCTNYTSSTHFMADVGAGIRFYVHGHLFVRPEGRLYLIHNNVEFNAGHVVRYGASVGYTFGGPSTP